MKVGILSTCQYSMFSGGLANTTIAMYEMMKTLGHDVHILNTNSDVSWYDDCKTLQKNIQVYNITLETQYEELYDFIIEMVPFLNGDQRKKIGKRFVYLYRRNILIPTIEYSLYPIINTKVNYDGVEAIWCFKDLCDESEKQILEVLTRKPVVILPYLWTPTIVEAHKNELQSPLWLQNSLANKQPNWSVHIFETNSTSSSSSTIPMLTLRQAKQANFPVTKYKVHNVEQIYKSQFFKDNVLKHCETADLSGEFVGRQRIVDLAHEPMSCVISHIRFLPFKPMLFDMAWTGVPFVHNSAYLKHITCFERYYYPDNSISQAVTAMNHMAEDFEQQKGWFDIKNIQDFRHYVLEHYSCLNQTIVDVYRVACEEKKEVVIERSDSKCILFTDMWENFNASYNFFTLLLENANPALKIDYYSMSTLPKGKIPNAILFGPFGEDWKQFPSVPKIHYTGENTMPIAEANLNLGFQHADMVSDNYLRFPLWILEIDWFGCDIHKIANPKPIALERCIKTFYNELDRKKFCAFVVSNPTNEIRNRAFQWLNEYKHVDSAGRLYNNVGDMIFAGGGGGGGELAKVEFLKDYKFCITFENNSSQGYVTEKLLHAKAAGCIPIYWGDPKVERDFNTNSFIDARKIRCKEDLLALVKAIDEDPVKYLEMYEKPALDEYHVAWARRTMSECASRIFKILEIPQEIPRFLVNKTTTSAFNSNASIQTPLLVTYATRDFLPSLNQWLASFDAQRQTISNINALVYLGADVPEEAKTKLQEAFPFVTYAYLPSAPTQFPDMFEAQHYAWKIYIYQELANNKDLEGKMILYMDAGAFMCRWPTEYLRIAQENDICVLSDVQQQNIQWCHDVCVKKMNITQDELADNQIVGGIMAFRVGDKCRAYFNEAWVYAQQRDIIVGEKWSGMRNGKPYGHRHDQSILSILSLRHNLTKYPLHTLYCDVSLRRTFLTNKYIYVHRGNFKLHEQFLEGIDDCFVINLKRRADRLEKLYANSPEFVDKIITHEAYEGKNLQMTPAIGRLFKPHDFMWKKAIMGCALSHLSLWYKLATDKPDINNYLILEDDVKFSKSWQNIWKEAQAHIPENYDIIYLGGVLPPNRGGFEVVKEKINPYFSRIKENQFFGQSEPNRYFHFCAYSYVLSKQGAQKVLHTILKRDGYYTSADHMLCNPVEFLNIYFLDPLVAGCYQDEDPKYANSEFNNFNRVDNFDSDLWNNDERFTNVESYTGEIDIATALRDGKNLYEEKKALNPIVKTLNTSRFYCLKKYNVNWDLLYEKKWLFELFGKDYIETIQIEETDEVHNGIFIVLGGNDYSGLFAHYKEKNIEFRVIHLSDEYGLENIEYYKDAKAVVRNYCRPNLNENVFVFPLGYHNGFESPMEKPYERTPQLPFRKNVWSFFGTNWANRSAILEPLKQCVPYELRLFVDWNDAKNLKEKEYISNLLDTIFVPCIQGNNDETYRFYEALECGCIPIIVESEYSKYITSYIPIFPLKSWDQAPLLIQQLMNDKQSLEAYRYTLLQSYSGMKITLKNELQKRLNLV